MINYIQLFAGVAVLTLVSFYVAWTKFRVLLLRQDLFDARDYMWDAARELGRLNDPAYLEVREGINSLIRSAHTINLPVLLYAFSNPPAKERVLPRSESSEMQQVIDRAIEKTVAAVTRYVIFYRPFSGFAWINTLMALLMTIKSVAAFRSATATWFLEGGPRQLEPLPCRQRQSANVRPHRAQTSSGSA